MVIATSTHAYLAWPLCVCRDGRVWRWHSRMRGCVYADSARPAPPRYVDRGALAHCASNCALLCRHAGRPAVRHVLWWIHTPGGIRAVHRCACAPCIPAVECGVAVACAYEQRALARHAVDYSARDCTYPNYVVLCNGGRCMGGAYARVVSGAKHAELALARGGCTACR